jgi:HK97 gp10 family phage protein
MGVKFVDNSRAVILAMEQACGPRLMRCGAILVREAKESMKQGGRSIGPRGGKRQTPSDPGTPPNKQTGILRASITRAATENQTVVVGPTMPYGQVHEFGGRHHPKRPFMRPALEKARGQFAEEFRDLPIAETPAGRSIK